MMIKRIMPLLVLLAAPFVLGTANAALMNQYSVTIDDGRDIEFAVFDVTLAGGFALTADREAGSSVDPELFLFAGDVSFGNFISTDDDGGGFPNSRILENLGVGSYVLAVGDFNLTLGEVVAGINYNNNGWRAGTGDVLLGVNGQSFSEQTGGPWWNPTYTTHSAGAGSFTSEVPEPTSIALLGIGLIAAGAGVRRNRKSA